MHRHLWPPTDAAVRRRGRTARRDLCFIYETTGMLHFYPDMNRLNLESLNEQILKG